MWSSPSSGIPNGPTSTPDIGKAWDADYIDRMSTGRINSPESIATASRVFRAFGNSWEAVQRAAERRPDGVYVISRRALEARERDPDA